MGIAFVEPPPHPPARFATFSIRGFLMSPHAFSCPEHDIWEYDTQTLSIWLMQRSPNSGFFVSSQEWVQAVTYTQITSSVVPTLAASVVLSAVVVFIFAGRPILTLLAALTLIFICASVMGIIYLLKWNLGATEVMSITSLVGLAVDFCIHVVEGYMEARAGTRRGNAR
jgi:predicted RND superfamily exporter protein